MQEEHISATLVVGSKIRKVTSYPRCRMAQREREMRVREVGSFGALRYIKRCTFRRWKQIEYGGGHNREPFLLLSRWAGGDQRRY